MQCRQVLGLMDPLQSQTRAFVQAGVWEGLTRSVEAKNRMGLLIILLRVIDPSLSEISQLLLFLFFFLGLSRQNNKVHVIYVAPNIFKLNDWRLSYY